MNNQELIEAANYLIAESLSGMSIDAEGSAKLKALAKVALAALEAPQPEPVGELYAELYQLREDAKGPDGFNTWKDAAIAEKKARVECEGRISRCGLDIDYLTAMAAFHSDEWHKMGPITGYMHGWNARKINVTDSSIQRDALRYRFLRDKDAFGDDDEPGLVSWDDLVDLELNDFDAAVDERMTHPDVAWFATLTAPPAPAMQPVKFTYCDFGAVSHMSGGSKDYCNGFVDGTQNAMKLIRAAGYTVEE
ncbi:hypothetical protein [Erwinia phyllosphaerae]|uniref:hypothetical protein n=1 Tax=Erwinia phyllosphaerae TaxID=2853256 RepID=UPI001FEE987D|nr:hypothetical protein [Erwinia phyllosphaerae]MBV4365871.1 hypothetical protein [Erwinia phyllosphaerae]